MSQELALSTLRPQEAQDPQVAGTFHLVEACASAEQLRKCTSDTINQVLQKAVTAEGKEEGSTPRRPQRVLLGHTITVS